jgi:hypothetical protein
MTKDETIVTDDPVVEALSNAEVEVEIDQFIDIFTAEGSKEARGIHHRMRLKRAHPRVSVDPNDPTTLVVRPRGATLSFTLSPEQYFPIGIAFHLREGVANPNDLQRLGFLNFTQMHLRPRGNMLSVTDEFKDQDADDRYKFSIIVQNSGDGSIGIIDPSIRHRPN